jgi:hypothetical protein
MRRHVRVVASAVAAIIASSGNSQTFRQEYVGDGTLHSHQMGPFHLGMNLQEVVALTRSRPTLKRVSTGADGIDFEEEGTDYRVELNVNGRVWRIYRAEHFGQANLTPQIVDAIKQKVCALYGCANWHGSEALMTGDATSADGTFLVINVERRDDLEADFSLGSPTIHYEPKTASDADANAALQAINGMDAEKATSEAPPSHSRDKSPPVASSSPERECLYWFDNSTQSKTAESKMLSVELEMLRHGDISYANVDPNKVTLRDIEKVPLSERAAALRPWGFTCYEYKPVLVNLNPK